MFNYLPKILIVQAVGGSGSYFPIYSLTSNYKERSYYKGSDYYFSFDSQSGTLKNCIAKFDENSKTLYWYAGGTASSPDSIQDNRKDREYYWYTLV